MSLAARYPELMGERARHPIRRALNRIGRKLASFRKNCGKMSANLLVKGLEILEAGLPKPWPLRHPTVVQFPVNDICDARCQMCNIWQQHLDRQLSLDEIDRVFSNPLFGRVTDVGLNGGEPTLRKDLPDIAEVLFRRLPALKRLSLITNGLKADRAIRAIDALAEVVNLHKGDLDVMVSLDGVGEIHDRVRGRPGNFLNAVKVLDHVEAHPGIKSVRIGCTVIRENVYHLHELFDFASQRGIYVKFRLGIPHQRLYTDKPAPKVLGKTVWLFGKPYDLDLPARVHLAEFLQGLVDHYEQSWQQRVFYRSLIGQLVLDAPRRAGCDWQHRGATVSSRGELMYCAVRSPVLGDAVTGDSEKIYFGSKPVLHSIIRNHCDQCAHDYTGRPDARVIVKELALRALARMKIAPSAIRRLPVLRWGFEIARRRRFGRRFSALISAPSSPAGRREADGPLVILCGWYGTETLGDKAILAGVVASVRRSAPNARFRVASLQPYITRVTCQKMPELRGAEVWTLPQAAAAVAAADFLIFAGGPLMAIDEIAEMEALFTLARKANVSTVIAGCGVGPLGERYVNQAIGRLLRLADLRIYRDQASRELAAARLDVDVRDDVVAEDPAFTWLAPFRGRRGAALAARPTLLLGLRQWPADQYAGFLAHAERERLEANFERAIVGTLKRVLRDHPGLIILPLPMCTHHHGGDDRLYYRRLLADAALAPSVDGTLLGREFTPEEYVSRFTSARATLAMRYHAAVFSIGLQVPTVVIDYTLGRGKVAALARAFGVPSFGMDDIDEDRLAAALSRQLDAGSAPEAPEPSFPAALSARLAAGVEHQKRVA